VRPVRPRRRRSAGIGQAKVKSELISNPYPEESV
jgi:hypothetical protein